ncbi:hypothetical protein [Microbacterium sp. LWH10-1.2]|uniref:hypothetical protein n=1 Tax=Microbacterium sp. LWH10-1.2 TaxID=3135255 RepID=UPI00313924BD
MSTDDERPDTPAVPRTRAEMRAAREAEAAAAAAADASGADAVDPNPTAGSSSVDAPSVAPSAVPSAEAEARGAGEAPTARASAAAPSEPSALAGGAADADEPASEKPAPAASTRESTPDAPASRSRFEPADEREAAMRAAMVEAAAAAAAATEAANRPADVSSRSARSTTGSSAIDPFARSSTEFASRSATDSATRSTDTDSATRSLSEERSDETTRPSPASTSDDAPAEAARTSAGVSSRSARSTTEESSSATGASARTTTGESAPTSEKSGASRRFALALASVLGILVLVGAGLGAVSLTQGPRITATQVDPMHAIESSGSRVILTANQSLAPIDDSQVTVKPAVPFTVDASGRGIGVRFTVPLDDSTKYTITVAGVTGAGGGPTTTLTKSFTTPSSSIFLLKRDAKKKDTIFRTDLTGEKAVPVFSDDKINDFRATSNLLVVSVEEDEVSKLYVMNRDGSNKRELKLPGVGYIGSIQVSDRGGLVGYTYSDQELSDTEGRASVLVTQPLSGGDPTIVKVGDKEANILVWQFVPDSAAMLFIDFDGALSLIDHSADSGVQSLGLATDIQGVSRGTYTAVIERLDGSVVDLNLADGTEQPLAASDPDYGTASTITPFPGGTLRHVASLDETGMPNGQAIVRVGDDGKAVKIAEVGPSDSILQACASPSGQYAAVAIAPNLADTPYDQMLLPLPQTVQTHLFDLRTGKELVALTGFDASWCATAPHY